MSQQKHQPQSRDDFIQDIKWKSQKDFEIKDLVNDMQYILLENKSECLFSSSSSLNLFGKNHLPDFRFGCRQPFIVHRYTSFIVKFRMERKIFVSLRGFLKCIKWKKKLYLKPFYRFPFIEHAKQEGYTYSCLKLFSGSNLAEL
jgi:hypothetical protein